jgi:hypothetical protein
MWNSLVSLAAQAKAAAEHLEDSINVSVGAVAPTNNAIANDSSSPASLIGTFGVDASMDIWNDSAAARYDKHEIVQESDDADFGASTYSQDYGTPTEDDADNPAHDVHGMHLTSVYTKWDDPQGSPTEDSEDVNQSSPELKDTVNMQEQALPAEGEMSDIISQDIDEENDSQQRQEHELDATRIVRIISPNIDHIHVSSTHDVMPIDEPLTHSSSNITPQPDLAESVIIQLQSQIQQLQEQLTAREEQLASKAEQIITIMDLHTKEKESLLTQVRETKEEAKKRILVAKERVTQMQQHVQRLEQAAAANHATTTQDSDKDELIQTLRSEGETLAKRMSEVEQRAKEIRVQSIDLQEQLASQTAIKEKMEKKVADLELELKTIRAKWTQAQQGEIRAEQLENNVLAIQEEVELKHAKILSLETEVKELKLSIVSLKQEKEDWIRNKEAESQVELAKWKKEKKEWTDELEAKTRDLQQEAQDREDALRKEVVELRKRWQEAVQRADGMYIICPLPWYTTL